MSDLNSKIEAAKEKVSSLKQEIDKLQKSNKDMTLSAAVTQAEYQPPPLRAPPATKLRRTLKGHFGKVTSLCWGGDSRLVVSASQDGNLLVWNAVTTNKVQSITLKSSYVMSVGIEQSKGNFVACGGLDNLCTVYPRSNPDKLTELASHDGYLSCCRFLSEQEILTSSGDSTCILWDIAAAKPKSTFAEHTADAMFLSLKPGDKTTFASCSVDQTAKIWDVRAPKMSAMTFRGHTGDINAIEFMPSDGNCFATCSQDGTVRVFDLRAYNEICKFGGVPNANSESDGFTSLTFSSSGRIIFCGHTDGSVYGFDILSSRPGPMFNIPGAHDRAVSCVGVSSAGNALCTGGWDSLLKIWA